MATFKSTAITNLDASPIVMNTAGDGGSARLFNKSANITAGASDAAATVYLMVRIPSQARVKHLWLESQAQGAGKVNASVYYSDSTTDGTPAAKQGVIVPTTGDQFFASDVDLASAVQNTDIINESGNNPATNRNKQLWDALGLTADPGGFFDIALVVHTTAITTGTGIIGLMVEYTD